MDHWYDIGCWRAVSAAVALVAASSLIERPAVLPAQVRFCIGVRWRVSDSYLRNVIFDEVNIFSRHIHRRTGSCVEESRARERRPTFDRHDASARIPKRSHEIGLLFPPDSM